MAIQTVRSGVLLDVADADVPRSGQQAVLGADLLAFMDSLAIDRAVLAGYDWGGRAA